MRERSNHHGFSRKNHLQHDAKMCNFIIKYWTPCLDSRGRYYERCRYPDANPGLIEDDCPYRGEDEFKTHAEMEPCPICAERAIKAQCNTVASATIANTPGGLPGTLVGSVASPADTNSGFCGFGNCTLVDIEGNAMQCLQCGRTTGGLEANAHGTPGAFSGWGSEYGNGDHEGTVVSSVHRGSDGEIFSEWSGWHRLSAIGEEDEPNVELPVVPRAPSPPVSETSTAAAWRERDEAMVLRDVAGDF